ncbi:MAG TPA: hypothetical protein VGE08_09840 [Steroidobacter sp.]|uniref:hypothetical protein n=1 Tax=Steroidobacter sp. TaxID=1978227 RepID=UPI002ED8DF15
MSEAVNITHREQIETRVLNEQVALMCRLTTSPLTASVPVRATFGFSLPKPMLRAVS